MLFISILLSIWFGLWLMHSRFIYDFVKVITAWLDAEYSDENDEDIDKLLKKSDDNTAYHLYCKKCGHDWWSVEPFVKFCPECGEKFDSSI